MRYKPRRVYSWSSNMAYIAGLLATDGCLSKDGRHIDFTSKDLQLVATYRDIIKPSATISQKHNGHGQSAYRVQFSDVVLYDFLQNAGFTPNKSKTIEAISIPDQYFADFVRGCFDGDGSTFSYWDKRWRASFQFYISFTSASPPFLAWLQKNISLLSNVSPGYIRPMSDSNRAACLIYAKADTLKLYAFIYDDQAAPRLERKHSKLIASFDQNPSL